MLDYASSVNRMRETPGAWRRTAVGAGLIGPDGSTRPTIFAEMSALAARTGAINLGQGFPDEDGPAAVLDAAREAIANGVNQYPPGRGIPDLLPAITEHQQRFYGLRLDPQRDVLVTAGATEALAAALLALIDGPDDEVVVFEPYYDSYAAVVALSGARLVTVPLRWPDFQPDLDELRAAVSDRTRVILVNDPHNPTGAVFSRELQDEVIRLANRHDAIIVTDEVYEHLVFDGPHVPIATLPGAWERTLTISSGGKTFSATGWKIGWVSGPADLVDAVLAVKQFLTYVNGAPFQPAIATGLRLPDAFFHGIARTLREQARPAGVGSASRRFRRLGARGLVLHRRGCRPARCDRRGRVLPGASRACGRGRDSAHRLRRPRHAGRSTRRSSGSRRASASRCSRKRHPASPHSRADRRSPPERASPGAAASLARHDAHAPQAQCGVDPAHALDGIAVEVGHDDVRRGADRGDLDALRVHDHRVAHAQGRWMVGGGDEDRVLDRPRVHERAPVVLLQRPAHPLRGNEEHIRTGVGERATDLGEAEVVAGHESESEAVAFEGLGWHQLPRLDPVRLALTERVVEVELAIGGDDPGRVDGDDRVAHAPAVRAALEETGHDVKPVRLGQTRERLHERPVEPSAFGASESSNGSTK